MMQAVRGAKRKKGSGFKSYTKGTRCITDQRYMVGDLVTKSLREGWISSHRNRSFSRFSSRGWVRFLRVLRKCGLGAGMASRKNQNCMALILKAPMDPFINFTCWLKVCVQYHKKKKTSIKGKVTYGV